MELPPLPQAPVVKDDRELQALKEQVTQLQKQVQHLMIAMGVLGLLSLLMMIIIIRK
jgi:hypothetical protein